MRAWYHNTRNIYHVYVMCDYNELIQMSNMLHTYIVIGCGVGVCYNAIWPKCVRRIYIDTPSHHYVSHARDKLMEWGHESVMERSVGSGGLIMHMFHASALVSARWINSHILYGCSTDWEQNKSTITNLFIPDSSSDPNYAVVGLARPNADPPATGWVPESREVNNRTT